MNDEEDRERWIIDSLYLLKKEIAMQDDLFTESEGREENLKPIPKEVRDILGIHDGDYVGFIIWKVEPKKAKRS